MMTRKLNMLTKLANSPGAADEEAAAAAAAKEQIKQEVNILRVKLWNTKFVH